MKFQKSPCNSSLSSSKVAFQFRSLSGGLEAASEWNTLVYNSLYKLKEELFPLAFVAESNEITDKTKLNLNGSDSKLVITMFNIR